MTRWIIASNDLEKFHSFEAEKSQFLIRRGAYLPVEGIGINGTFFVKGWTVVRGNNLFVSASGYSAPMELPANSGAFNFYGSVTLLKESQPLARKKLERNSRELWADDKYTPIGSASFVVPPHQNQTAYSVLIEVSYTFSSSSGSATPIPQFAKTTIGLTGVR